MTLDERLLILSRYVDGAITAEQAADMLGPYTSVAEVVIEARERLGRLPDRQDAFTRQEFRRGLKLLGLESKVSD